MNEIDNIAMKVANEIDTEDKKINIHLPAPLTTEQLMAIQSIKRLKNPFKMLSVKDVMQDLNICETIGGGKYEQKQKRKNWQYLF